MESPPVHAAVDTMVIPPERSEKELIEAGSEAVVAGPIDTRARLWLALAMVALLGVVAAVLVWGLVR